MVGIVFDTNILIDFLRGLEPARDVIEATAEPTISIVTWIEVLAGVPATDDGATRRFLSRFELVPLGPEVAELATTVRQRHRLKLPDAVVLATALSRGAELVTRDEKAFARVGEGVVFPYRVRPSEP